MGYRVHVVKQTEKFADIEAFNWKNQEFAELLDALGCDMVSIDGYERFECRKEYFKTAINLVKCYKENGTVNLSREDFAKFGIFEETSKELFEEYRIDPDYVDEQLASVTETFGFPLSYVLDTMEIFLNESDPESDWIIFVVY